MSGSLRFERDAADARIGHLVLSHPGRMNAIGVAMWRSLREIAAGLDGQSPTLHAVIVRGEGGCFAAGADIAEFPHWRFETGKLREYHEHIVAPALQALRAADVPLVAQIDGACIGGGLEIALCCDLRIGARDARFGVPVARLGFPMAPDEASILLDALSRDTVAELLLEARLHGADWALQRGLVQRLADDPAAEARATALRLAALPTEVARANKRTLRLRARGPATEAERAAHFDYAGSPVHRAGVAAFLGQPAEPI
ncbi:MAG TPA: enoyl-CoA hydratase/isomerase family protein [Methylibium sp.]|nr:enoyl-CoA hydratase/isomerase family protein [Methylibium sp.]